MKHKTISTLLDLLFFVAGSFLFAVSVNTFTAPNNIAPGGMAGLGTMINYLTGVPIGILIAVLNIPIFLWGIFEVGFRFIAKTIAATFLSSVIIDLTADFLPVYHGDMMLTTVFGGVLAGLGLSLVFIRGGTTGGTDLIANLIGNRVRFLSIGKLILMGDMVVVLLSAAVYRNFESPLYAVIVIFITSKVIDTVLYGTNSGTGKMMFIISPHNRTIAEKILTELKRGVTELKSRGSYSGIEGEVLLCAVRRQEVYKTYDIVRSIDPNAFIVVGDAGEISGEGFRHLSKTASKKRKKAESKNEKS